MSASEDAVALDVADGVATIVLNRPDRGNALDEATSAALASVAERAARDRDARCVLLTGRGRFFCVGGDVAAFERAGRDAPALLARVTDHLHAAVLTLARMGKPLVVAANGPAAGAGLGFAVLGDVVIASEEAHFSMAYSGIALTPDAGTSLLLPRLIGLRRTQEMAFQNRRVPAAEAAAIGLIHRVVPGAELASEAAAAAAALADGPTKAFAATRRLLLAGHDLNLEEQLDLEARTISKAAGTAEGREGIEAFAAKRRPDYRRTAA